MPDLRPASIPAGPVETIPVDAIVDGLAKVREANLQALLDALKEIPLGGYDRHVAGWLADCQPGVVATVCSWLRRVHDLARPGAPTVTGVLLDAADLIDREGWGTPGTSGLGLGAAVEQAAGGDARLGGVACRVLVEHLGGQPLLVWQRQRGRAQDDVVALLRTVASFMEAS